MSIIVSRNIELMNSLSSPMISAIFELKFCVDCFSIRFNEQQNYSFQDIAPYEFKLYRRIEPNISGSVCDFFFHDFPKQRTTKSC